MDPLLELFRRTAADVPAYREFLRGHGVSPEDVTTLADFERLPLVTKESYCRRFPLPSLCRDGALERCDMIAVSSGSSGQPTVWPRTTADELVVADRFEQVFRDGFGAAERSTLAVVCFPLGTWVGGLFTLSCLRHLAGRGYGITGSSKLTGVDAPQAAVPLAFTGRSARVTWALMPP